MQKLTSYLVEHGLTVREFAALVGISSSFVWEITAVDQKKRKHPSLETALRIQVATRGEVSVGDWPKLARIANAIYSQKLAEASPDLDASRKDAQ